MFCTLFFRFATQQRNGLLFYNGRFNEKHDFIALEIVDGQVQFSFSLGNLVSKVSPYIEGGVNDGHWHQVTVAYLNKVSWFKQGFELRTVYLIQKMPLICSLSLFGRLRVQLRLKIECQWSLLFV